MTTYHTSLNAARAAPLPVSRSSPLMLSHGTMQVRFYAPRDNDPQTPHDQDELYIVCKGQGYFVNGEQRQRFIQGDVLFVPAGREHRFEEFSNDLEVWVIFYGPTGGEA